MLQKNMNPISQSISESTFHKMFCKSFKTVTQNNCSMLVFPNEILQPGDLFQNLCHLFCLFLFLFCGVFWVVFLFLFLSFFCQTLFVFWTQERAALIKAPSCQFHCSILYCFLVRSFRVLC